MASILPFSNALGNAPFHHKYHAQVNLSKHSACRQQRVETKIITCTNSDQKGEPHSHRQTQNGKIRRQEINVSVFILLFFCRKNLYYYYCKNNNNNNNNGDNNNLKINITSKYYFCSS
jgi:hypothetical protein